MAQGNTRPPFNPPRLLDAALGGVAGLGPHHHRRPAVGYGVPVIRPPASEPPRVGLPPRPGPGVPVIRPPASEPPRVGLPPRPGPGVPIISAPPAAPSQNRPVLRQASSHLRGGG